MTSLKICSQVAHKIRGSLHATAANGKQRAEHGETTSHVSSCVTGLHGTRGKQNLPAGN